MASPILNPNLRGFFESNHRYYVLYGGRSSGKSLLMYLIGKNIEIGLLTARSDRKKHANLLNKLRIKLKEYGLEINKIYFVNVLKSFKKL